MAVFVRSKRVTDPLDDRVKACLCGEHYWKTGYVSSSASEHEAEDSTFLSDLVQGFLEDCAGSDAPGSPEDSDGNGSDLDPTDPLKDLLNPTADDRFRTKLLSHVSKAVEELSADIGVGSCRSALRPAVMASLRDSGYNAGICKTRWESSGGLVGGSYEFVDVVRSVGKGGSSQRYLIDVDFAAEFEIARPTERYLSVAAALPTVYVGRPEDLKRVVRVVSEEMKRSLRSSDLHLPPWRKSRYMQARWLGPYKRTVGQIPARTPASYEGERLASGKCRSVGFDTGSSCRFVLPAATPTR